MVMECLIKKTYIHINDVEKNNNKNKENEK